MHKNSSGGGEYRSWPAALAALVLAAALGGCAAAPHRPSVGVPPSNVLEVLTQFAEIKEEIEQLRNTLEEIQFDTESARRRQQHMFADLDRRLLRLEQAQGLTPLSPASGLSAGDASVTTGIPDITAPGAQQGITPDVSGAASTAVPPPAVRATISPQEQESFDQAIELTKQSQYEDAIAQFEQFIARWPDSQLADDSFYWIARTRHLNRDFEAALVSFNALLSRYPQSPRAPDALLRIGITQYDIGAYEDAAKTFRDVLARFPGHDAANMAQIRLRRIEQTIQ